MPAWRIPWKEEPGGLHSPWGCKELDMTESLSLSLCTLGFPGGSVVKNLPAKQETWVQYLGSVPGSGRSPGEGNGNPLSILAWEIPWTEEPGGLHSPWVPKSLTGLRD